MAAGERTPPTPTEAEARKKQLDHYMARNAFELFKEFAEQHGIDPDDDPVLTAKQEEEWAKIQRGLAAHYDERKNIL